MGQRVYSREINNTLPADDRSRYALQMVTELSKEINAIARKAVEGKASLEEQERAAQLCIILNKWIATLQTEL